LSSTEITWQASLLQSVLKIVQGSNGSIFKIMSILGEFHAIAMASIKVLSRWWNNKA